MGRTLRRWILGLCVLAAGCSPTYNVTLTTFLEPLAFNDTADKIVEVSRDCKLAKQAWEEVVRCNPGAPYSCDYAKGFKEGYADYLYAGGPATPPPVPPRCYWKPKYETPEGYQAIEDWYAGFRHGAAVAQASGYREYVPVPTWVPPPSARRPPPPPPAPPAPPAPEQLPAPRPDSSERGTAQGSPPPTPPAARPERPAGENAGPIDGR